MGLGNRMLATLSAILDGEQGSRCARSAVSNRCLLGKVITGEEGMLSLTVGVFLLGFVVMFGLIGNIGRNVKEKIEIQNASDAVAYSSSLWMARGANAVTATNHLLGELTALCVLHEAIGGPLLDRGGGTTSNEMVALNTVISGLSSVSYTPADATLVQQIVQRLTEDRGRPPAGAMLYDARMQLKAWCAGALGVKALGNALIASGYGAALGAALHVAGTAVLIKVRIEWELLAFLEQAARVVTQTIKPRIQQQVVPAIAGYGEVLARKGPGGVVGPAIQHTVTSIADLNRVQAVLDPSPMSIELPIIPEAAPRSGGTSSIPYVSGKDYGSLPPVLSQLGRLNSSAMNLVEYLFDFLGWINDLPVIPGPLKVVQTKLREFERKFRDAVKGLRYLFPDKEYAENPSGEALKKMNIDWSHEEKAQWTRATYPYVDKFRINFAQSLNNYLLGAPLSNAATWYMRWTSRFTLAKSVEFRRGKFSSRPLHMYILADSSREKKGREPWTDDSRRAEDLFTVMAFSRRDVRTIMSSSAFGQPRPREIVTYSQAILYDSNTQDPTSGGDYQPKLGWDTLNWNPADSRSAPEYRTVTDPGGSGSVAPWDALLKWNRAPKVKLNWQAKLVPVTSRRLQAAWLRLPGDYRKPLRTAPVVTKYLDTH